MALLLGTSTNDFIDGTNNADTVIANAGDDNARGFGGTDNINGNQGNDVINGNVGSDTLHGGRDNDTVFGGRGDDELWGDRNTDVLTGGIGNDLFVLDNRSTGSTSIAAADRITDFSQGGELGRDLLGLSNGLSFADLGISQGTGANSAHTIIQDNSTGLFLGIIENFNSSAITGADFGIDISPTPVLVSILE
ncbi:hemolysin-type calcium-binding region [Thalassoporum mexicanum PCC 7367]|uniref:calcium-binding protein n=1 Tax=Thalassoporum mexicanum TaxID=3457544 RepID=UPI00029FA425|nr:calcium-binding protein [Pseudanabaena sp. PCC 7367]AFY70166.1 hemolysin-type calcium-binding region [Pseudanabaena sp. PCC 7367]